MTRLALLATGLTLATAGLALCALASPRESVRVWREMYGGPRF